ncbi:MAG: TetR/AcrR family transcriptional regulator [Mesorhizobium sp.]|uniref:TetR/AcrR family transcriptional regulator n=1 Tax=Mesorhizobium sp. M1E.F.Ca.ET.045.02.1.1 TaxID=2493672 RepID=UPI000F75E3F2|nr:TetR/AcrR family transcriptional regulator [Mesorhizobium sp. M1E.F.Ca.ET.045.02.1.1]AZO19834.1 TetR/AcrR family transcriptional regulator [Mesorhizobium sp. M1E.F.Ca.ET.045.02.1.1]TIU32376.1 MAG: TetR/AcrR family transcriptional regulator [Mesorhizobium sp.]TKB14970.1 MAG: TetR/AcrR family transcriptional regulator [Mesorhizobium sp.]
MALPSIASNDHSAAERLRIIRAGTAACRLYGPSKTTVADIARLLGKSPASLYRTFSSKAEIWDAIAADFYESDLCFEPSSAGHLTRATDQLKETMLGHHRLLLQAQQGDPQMYGLIVLTASSNWPSYRQYRNRLHSLVGELIRDGIRTKEFQPTHVHAAASCLCASLVVLWDPRFVGATPPNHCEISALELVSFAVDALR